MTKEIEVEGFGAFAEALEGIYNRPAIPETTGATTGDVLTIGSDGPEWAEVPKELPDTTGASTGDVLSLGSSGPEWATPAGGVSYSTTEREVGKWVDGSTLYEKTIVKQNISSASSSTVLIPSSELTGINIVEIGGSYISTTQSSTYPINAYINSNSMITTWLAEGDIYYWLYWGEADTYNAYITIRYTKVTV